MSSLMLNNWKNGVLINKEHKYKSLAKLTIAAELILALVGTLVLSQNFVSFHYQIHRDIHFFLYRAQGKSSCLFAL
jgi:hypothetical protein